MNHWQKLGLPIALGLCAAYLNWQSVIRVLEPRDYVAVNDNIQPGELLTQEMLTPISISHTSNVGLEKALVPWSQHAALVGRYAQRPIKSNAPLTQFDVAEANVAEKADYEDVVEVRMTLNERKNTLIFVNDRVNMRNETGDQLNGCRVLSISRGKDDYCVRLAVVADQLRKFRSRGRSDFRLQICGRTSLTK